MVPRLPERTGCSGWRELLHNLQDREIIRYTYVSNPKVQRFPDLRVYTLYDTYSTAFLPGLFSSHAEQVRRLSSAIVDASGEQEHNA